MPAEAHLIASCTTCGAPQTLTLAAPAGACGHCGAASPLPPGLRAKLDGLRAQLSSRDAKPRQLTVKALVAGDALHGAGAITIAICWALFGGIAVYVALDHDVPLVRFLTRGEPSEQWWLLWAFALGVPLSVASLEGAVARVRGLSAHALPAPPLQEGGSPRCRCCAAQLPTASALRRCGYCHTDNLVVTGRYLRAEADVHDALDRMEKAFDGDLEARIATGDTIAMAGSVIPFFLLFIGPAVGLAVTGQPQLWVVPAGVLLVAVLLTIWGRVRRLPVEPLELLGLGQEVYVRDDEEKGWVCAQLMLPEGPVSLIGSRVEETRLAVSTHRRGGELETIVYRVKPGKGPVGPAELARVIGAELWEHVPSGPPRIRPVRVLTGAGSWQLFLDEGAAPALSGNRSGKPPHIVVL